MNDASINTDPAASTSASAVDVKPAASCAGKNLLLCSVTFLKTGH